MTDRVDISNVLAEIRNLRAQMQQPVNVRPEMNPNAIQPTQKTNETPGFGDMLKTAVDKVNDLQKETGQLRNAYQAGDPEVDLTSVMIASQKSSVGFQALVQVRNKVVRAYEDIMKMPV